MNPLRKVFRGLKRNVETRDLERVWGVKGWNKWKAYVSINKYFRKGGGECKEKKSSIQFWIHAHVHVFV